MSEKISVSRDVISAFEAEYDRLLASYKKVYVTLARAELRAETRNRPIAYESGLKRSLEIMERTGFLSPQDLDSVEIDERGILRE